MTDESKIPFPALPNLPAPKQRTHCACGKPIPDPETKEVGPSMYFVPRYTCSVQCHNDSILGINAFTREKGVVGRGWMPIVIECHERLLKEDPDYNIVQIKEKFGGLRYYFDRSGNTDDRPRVRLKWDEQHAISWAINDIKRLLNHGLEGLKYHLNEDGTVEGLARKNFEKQIERLRGLYSRSDRRMDQIVNEAERKCDATCEICGDPAQLDNSDYYVITLCEAHTKQRAETGKPIWQLEDDYNAENPVDQ